MSQGPQDMSRAPGRAILRVVRAVERRTRLASAAALLARVALPLGCLLAAVGVAATRRLDAPTWLGWLGLVPTAAVLLYVFLRPARPRLSARRLDAYYGLHDLIGNALELAERPPRSDDPRAADLVELHLADAEAAAQTLDPRPVVPLRPPGLRLVDLAAAALLLGAMLLPVPPPPVHGGNIEGDRTEEPLTRPPRKPPPDASLAEPLREDLRKLKDGDDRAAELAERMLAVLDAYGRGEIDREAAFAELEQLEKELAEAEAALEANLEEDPGLLAEGVRKLAEALQQEEVTQPAGEAFARGDGDQAESALADAEAAAEAGDEADRQMQRAMAQAEKALGKAAGENTDTAAQLAEAERRLKKQQQQPAADPEEQERRLKKQQDKVEELRRQHEREKAAQRKLEELRRQANEAQKGQKGSPQRKRALEQLRREAGDAARKSSASRRLGQARDDLEEAKSFLRRAGNKGGEQDDKRRKQMQKFSQAANGKRGDKNKGPTLLVEGELGDGEPDMLIEGDDGGDPQDSGNGGDPQDSGDGDGDQQGDSGGQSGQGQGDGIGQGTADPLGDPSGLKVKKKDVRVDPKQGRGMTKAEIIRTASQEGFASEAYRDMYRDYRSFAQSSLDSEALPAEQRRRVKRYFQMIQPRR